MQHRTRTFKTLFFLVGSMVGTSALLGWMSPSAPPAVVEVPFDAVLRQTASDLGEIEGRAWGFLEVGAVAGRPGSTRLAARVRPATDSHFVVNQAGGLQVTSSWHADLSAHEPMSGVRVELLREGAEPMTRAQWDRVCALSRVLGGQASTSGVPVFLAPAWADLYGVDAQTAVLNGHTP